ncbi:30S ribosomal protein S18 [Salmonella enterica subsp. enterica]|nr:30S ribosomal protein S18 [Salmonella enterica subsp. enterica]
MLETSHGALFPSSPKFCRFTAEGVPRIDYKDLATLKNYITESGKDCPKPYLANPCKTSVGWLALIKRAFFTCLCFTVH